MENVSARRCEDAVSWIEEVRANDTSDVHFVMILALLPMKTNKISTTFSIGKVKSAAIVNIRWVIYEISATVTEKFFTFR